MSSLWNSLTSVQRAAWDTFAALGAQALTNSLGETYYASGWNWFCKTNVRLLRVGRSTISATPTIARPSAPAYSHLCVTLPGTDTNVGLGGTPWADSQEALHVAADGIDDDTATYWQALSPATTGLFLNTLATSKAVRMFRIYIPTIAANNYNPKSFQLKAKVGADPTQTIATFTNWIPTATGWHRFCVNNDVVYDKYYLNITANGGHATELRLYEWELYEGQIDNSNITYTPAAFEYPYDLILHIAMANSQSKIVQYPGYYEILATQSPGYQNTSIQTNLPESFGTLSQGRRWFSRLYRQTSEGIRSAPATDAADTEEA